MSDIVENPPTSDAEQPRSARRLVAATVGLYRRYPLLFLVLAAGVIVPYQAIVLAATGAGPFAQSSLSFGVGLLLTLVEWVLIGPLIAALHVHAVGEVREGRDPRLAPPSPAGTAGAASRRRGDDHLRPRHRFGVSWP